MIPRLVLFFTLGLFFWLLKRDGASRPGFSPAIWIPTLWVGIIASRPVSLWLGRGGGTDTLEGSPIDALFYFGFIIAAWIVLSRRRLQWSVLIQENWAVFLFYGYLLVSVLWANSSFASFKRWFKEFGNILVLLVILTEAHPQQAIRVVFVRCAYLLLPLSLVFIRYFPELGRHYNRHSGGLEAVGVTSQKNSLGVTILVCGLILFWDWLQLRREVDSPRQRRFHTITHWSLLLLGAYLLHMCDSKTSILCLVIGILIIAATRLPFLQQRLRILTVGAVVGALGFWVLDQLFGIKEDVVQGLGRDMTFTGRTDVWRELLNLKTDPLFGTGFMSFWDDKQYQSKLPDWVAFSAHNGYLEEYLAGGWLAIFFLSLMLLVTGLRINKNLMRDGDYGVVRFAIYAITLIANFSESNFACMTPVGFIFLLAAIGHVSGFVSQATTEPATATHPEQGVEEERDFHVAPAIHYCGR